MHKARSLAGGRAEAGVGVIRINQVYSRQRKRDREPIGSYYGYEITMVDKRRGDLLSPAAGNL